MTTPLLCVDHSPVVGGAARVFFTVVDAMDRTRFDPIVVCNPGPVAAEAAARSIEVVSLPLPMLTFAGGPAAQLRSVATVASAARSLHALVRQRRPAAVYASGLASALYSAKPAVVARVPLLWHVHEIYEDRYRMRPFVAAAGLAASIVICVSLAAARRVGSLGVRPNKVRVVHNALPVPFAAAAPDDSASHPFRPPDGLAIVAVGALTPAKGHWVLIRAMVEVVRSVRDATLVIVGEPLHAGDAEYLEALRADVHALGLEDRVRFLGFRQDAHAIIRSAQVLVHPSTCEESFGLVVLEAMACGVPVIASRIGGLPELIDDNRTGMLVPAGNATALARAIVTVLDDSGLRARLGAEACRAAENFTRARMIDGLNAAFAEAVPESPVLLRGRSAGDSNAG